MQPLSDDNKLIIDRLSELGLSNAMIRDLSSILPFIQPDQWFTSISLRKHMSQEHSFTRKELSNLSKVLSRLYNETELLERAEKRKLYWRFYMRRHISHWAYKLNSQTILNIMPNPELEAYRKEKAHQNFLRSIE